MAWHELILHVQSFNPEALEVIYRIRTIVAELSHYHCINLNTDIEIPIFLSEFDYKSVFITYLDRTVVLVVKFDLALSPSIPFSFLLKSDMLYFTFFTCTISCWLPTTRQQRLQRQKVL